MALKAGGLPPEPRYPRVFAREKGICSERGGGSRLIHRSVSENYFFGHVFLSLIYIKRDLNSKFCCVKWRSKRVFAQPYNVHACLSAKRAGCQWVLSATTLFFAQNGCRRPLQSADKACKRKNCPEKKENRWQFSLPASVAHAVLRSLTFRQEPLPASLLPWLAGFLITLAVC